jgi:RNA polymerase sigma-54 factor
MQTQPSLGLSQRQQLTLTPQIRQALHLLQCSSQELALEIDHALAVNPLLESPEDTGDSAGSGSLEPPGAPPLPWVRPAARTVTDDIPEAAAAPSLPDHLLQQLHTTRASERDRLLVGLLIGELDERGYLAFDPVALSAQLPHGLQVSVAEWRVALRLLQSFDPVGIAACDLPECLRLQLDARAGEWPQPVLDLALRLTGHLEDLAAGRWGRLCEQLGCDRANLEAARAALRRLEPRPLRAWATDTTHYVVPDVLLEAVQGQWRVMLNPAAERPLRLSPDLAANLAAAGVATGLQAQLVEARNLIHSLNQRRQTILRVAQSIVLHQQGFLEQGVRALLPLTQQEVAQELGLHESTVSRATRLKYLQTRWGVFELRRFFGAGVPTDTGEATAARAVQALMRELLAAEPVGKPLSDMRLAQLLAQRGVTVARRTVAKYREVMGVLPASLRRR